MQKYYQDEPKFNGVYSRNNLHKIKDGAYAINLDELNIFGAEHIPKEMKKFIGNKNILTNIYRIQTYNSIMCGYVCTGFIDFMLNGPSLLDYTSLFSPNDYEKNNKIILKYFQ